MFHISNEKIIRSPVIFRDTMPRIFFVIPLALMTTGCVTVYLDMTHMNKTVAMTDSLNRPYSVIKHFTQEQKAYFILLGFFKISNPDFTEVLKTEIKDSQADAIINTSLEVEYDFIDTIVPLGIGVIGTIILGPVGLNLYYVFSMQTYRIKGDVIRYSQ
jgi:hypothetical protein